MREPSKPKLFVPALALVLAIHSLAAVVFELHAIAALFCAAAIVVALIDF